MSRASPPLSRIRRRNVGTDETAGLEYRISPDAKAGFAINHTYLAGNSGSGIDGKTNLDGYQAGFYGSLGNPALFFDSLLIAGIDDATQSRSGSFGTLQSDQTGTSVVAALRAGALRPAGPIALGPIASVAFSATRLDPYQESGDSFYAMGVDRQMADSVIAGGGIQIRGTRTAASPIDPFVDITYEHQFPLSNQPMSSFLVDLPTQSFQTPQSLTDPNVVKAALGTKVALSESWRGYVAAYGLIGFEGAYAAGASVGLACEF